MSAQIATAAKQPTEAEAKRIHTVQADVLKRLSEETNVELLREYIKVFKINNHGAALYVLACYTRLSEFEELDASDCDTLRTYAQALMLPLRSTTEYTKPIYLALDDSDKSAKAEMYRGFRNEVFKDAIMVVDLAIKLCENIYKKSAESKNKAMILWASRFSADYSRYRFEIINDEESRENARKHNDYSWELCQSEKMPLTSQHTSGCALNRSVYIHDVENNPKGAIDFTEEYLRDAQAEFETRLAADEYSKEQEKAIRSIFVLMKQNLELWVNEERERKEATPADIAEDDKA